MGLNFAIRILLENKIDIEDDLKVTEGDGRAPLERRLIDVANALNKLNAPPPPVGWIEFNSNEVLFDIAAKSNCLLLFEDGSECNYNDEHPMEVLTHFKLVI